MKLRKSTINRIISRAASILKEDMDRGIDMLNWNELQVGDLIDVNSDWESFKKVRITKKLSDISIESGLPAGPGFVGYPIDSPYGEEESFVFPVADVDVTSYKKYALAERRKRRCEARLKHVIKEYSKN